MSLARFALVVASVGASACAVEESEPTWWAAATIDECADVTELSADGPAFCDQLPDAGPCALACDPSALAQAYVPVGACAVFLCTLDDGHEINVHACHPPE
jgi:hypothetical protein